MTIVKAVNRFTRISETAQVTALAVLAAAVAGAPTLADLGKMWRLAGAVGGPVLVAVLALLNHFAQRQAKRLDISLETQPDPVVVPAFPDDGEVIGRWLMNERGECLASVAPPAPPEPPPNTPRAERGGFRAADVSDDASATLAADVSASETPHDTAEQDPGERLTPVQRQIAASMTNVIAPAINAASAQFASMVVGLSQPDRRTEEEYRSQVEEYLGSSEAQLRAHLRWNFFETGRARLNLVVVNKTDRTFESVQVEVHLPGPVEAVDPQTEEQPRENLPARPKPFGERTMNWDIAAGSRLLGVMPHRVDALGLSAGPDIDNTGSAHVTFPPFTLRPKSRHVLDPVHLVIDAQPGTVIDGGWTATATNAEGQATGPLRVLVASAPDVVELLSGEIVG